MGQCGQTFVVKRNRTLHRFRWFSRRQENKKSLQQLWNAISGLAKKCKSEGQTKSLVYDIFILSIDKKEAQKRLCTESKGSPEEAVHFAVEFKESLYRQAEYAEFKVERKSQPNSVLAITNNAKFAFDAAHITVHHSKFPNARQ